MTEPSARCHCGEDDCLHLACDYPWCRPCQEHHRAPECPVDEHGRALAPCGHPWNEDPCTTNDGEAS